MNFRFFLSPGDTLKAFLGASGNCAVVASLLTIKSGAQAGSPRTEVVAVASTSPVTVVSGPSGTDVKGIVDLTLSNLDAGAAATITVVLNRGGSDLVLTKQTVQPLNSARF